MIKIDLNGYLLHNENNKSKVILTEDGRPEYELTRVIARKITSNNHLIKMREYDLSLQERCTFLLDGSRGEMSLSLRLGDWEGPGGFAIKIPRNRYKPDIFLAELIAKYLTIIPGYQEFSSKMTSPSLLLPPRSVDIERPARCEVIFGSTKAEDWRYWLSPPRLIMIAQQLTKAMNEFDARFNELGEELEEAPLPLIQLDETEEKTEKPVSTKPKKKSKRVSLSLHP